MRFAARHVPTLLGCSHKLRRRRLVPAEEITLPILEAIDRVVIRVFRRPADKEPVAHLFLVIVLRPAVAWLAKRDFVPLAGLVIVPRLGEGLAMPDLSHAFL